MSVAKVSADVRASVNVSTPRSFWVDWPLWQLLCCSSAVAEAAKGMPRGIALSDFVRDLFKVEAPM